MKALYFQDGHFKGKNPGQRTDNYPEAWKLKFQEFLDIGLENNVDCFLDGGDIFDIPNISNMHLDDIIDMIEKAGKPFYCLYGNHCQIGQNIETSKGTSLAHAIRRSDLINYFDNPYIKHGFQRGFTIEGFDYFYGVEEDIKENGIILPESPDIDVYKIAVVHAFITPKPFLPEVDHIVCDDIKTNADLVLVAHYHSEWEKKIGDTTFLDIGNFGRCAISEHKIKPKCLLIDTDKRSYNAIEIKCAKEGSEIFNLDKIEEIKKYDKNITNFISSLQNSKVRELNLKSMVSKICKEQKIDKEIEDIVIKELG